jgi:hypothetical protein
MEKWQLNANIPESIVRSITVNDTDVRIVPVVPIVATDISSHRIVSRCKDYGRIYWGTGALAPYRDSESVLFVL